MNVNLREELEQEAMEYRILGVKREPAALGFELLDVDGRGEPVGYGVAVCRGCVRQAAQTALEVLDMSWSSAGS